METDSAEPISTADILRDILAQKMGRNPSFSLRAFARDLDVSHTYLSLVLNGKKTLSMKKVVQFCNILKLEQKSANSFIQASARETKGRAFQKAQNPVPTRKSKTAKPEEAYFILETDRFRVLDDWYHIPILDLTFLDDFKSDENWIARKLDLAPTQVRDAIQRLKRLGLLEERNGKLVKTHAKIFIPRPNRPDPNIRKYHKSMINRALIALESADPDDFAGRDITGVTIPIDPSLIPEARERISKFRKSLWKFLSSGEHTELYQLNIQLVPLTRRKIGRDLVKGEILKRGSK